MVNKWSPGCNCECVGCPECTEYGSTVYYTLASIVHGGSYGYANASKPSTGTNIRWSYWTGSTDLFNTTGSFTLPSLSGTVPNRLSSTGLITHSTATISVWISELVPIGDPKPSISIFYEYEVELTFKQIHVIYDDCGTREYFTTVGRSSSTITKISPFDASAGFATITTPSPIGDWIYSSGEVGCSYPLVADTPGSAQDNISITLGGTESIITPFVATGGTCTLSLTP